MSGDGDSPQRFARALVTVGCGLERQVPDRPRDRWPRPLPRHIVDDVVVCLVTVDPGGDERDLVHVTSQDRRAHPLRRLTEPRVASHLRQLAKALGQQRRQRMRPEAVEVGLGDAAPHASSTPRNHGVDEVPGKPGRQLEPLAQLRSADEILAEPDPTLERREHQRTRHLRSRVGPLGRGQGGVKLDTMYQALICKESPGRVGESFLTALELASPDGRHDQRVRNVVENAVERFGVEAAGEVLVHVVQPDERVVQVAPFVEEASKTGAGAGDDERARPQHVVSKHGLGSRTSLASGRISNYDKDTSPAVDCLL